MRRRAWLLATMLAAAGLPVAGAAGSAAAARQTYVVVLDRGTPDVPAVAADIARRHGGRVGFVYEHALAGFSIELPTNAVAALERNPRVDYVEADRTWSINAQTVPTGVQRIFADDNASLDIDGRDDFRVDVDVAVIDTGIDWSHPDLHVVAGISCASGFFTASCSGNGDDDHYHGTHVAGTIAALDNDLGVVGVAPGARRHAVKVLNSQGSGRTSWIVAGINWVAARADQIEVANMSLGGSGFSQAQYDAIQGAVNKGVAFAMAAGNSDANASNYSPAAFNNVLSVSALADFTGAPGGGAASTCRSDQDDTLADFSNWGSAVDITAPGVCILSTYPIERGNYGTISGTSMASPHVAGALALVASRNNPNGAGAVNNLYSQVVNAGNLNWTDDSGDGSKERLLDVGNATEFNPVLVAGDGGGGDPPTNQAPTDSFTFSCSGLTCSFTDTSTDPNGNDTIDDWTWTFGDGTVSPEENPSHAYGAAGTYTVTLIVADTAGAESAPATQSVTVTAPPSSTIALAASAFKVRGDRFAALSWTPSGSVTVLRNGSLIATTTESSYEDGPLGKGGGSATYQVCATGTTMCSNQVTVTW